MPPFDLTAGHEHTSSRRTLLHSIQFCLELVFQLYNFNAP